MNASKYMAAAHGGANMASRSVGNIRIPYAGARSKGSLAGLEGGKSAWIQMKGSGYGKRVKPPLLRERPPIKSYNSTAKSMVSFNDYTTPSYHGLNRDRGLSKLL